MILSQKLGLTAGITLLVFLITLPAQSRVPQQSPVAGSAVARPNPDLSTKIWNLVQESQDKYSTGCGAVTETRTSELLEQPLVLRGNFCAAGTTRFNLAYSEPHPLRITFNEDYMNVSSGSATRSTEVFKIGHHVRRTQGYFSQEHSIDNIKDTFVVLVQESAKHYEMRLEPKTKRFKKRINYIVITLDKENGLLHSLEVDGISGVNSLFKIEISDLNTELSEDTFRVYRPR
jgi:outer membrane lipoprotein-sorting protein